MAGSGREGQLVHTLLDGVMERRWPEPVKDDRWRIEHVAVRRLRFNQANCGGRDRTRRNRLRKIQCCFFIGMGRNDGAMVEMPSLCAVLAFSLTAIVGSLHRIRLTCRSRHAYPPYGARSSRLRHLEASLQQRSNRQRAVGCAPLPGVAPDRRSTLCHGRP